MPPSDAAREGGIGELGCCGCFGFGLFRRGSRRLRGQEGEGVSGEEVEGGFVAEVGEGFSGCQGGLGISGEVGVGMRERVRDHFKMVRRVLSGEFEAGQGDRVVHWGGPSVRRRGVQVGVEEAVVTLQSYADDFVMYAGFAKVTVGGEQLFGPIEAMRLVLRDAGF